MILKTGVFNSTRAIIQVKDGSLFLKKKGLKRKKSDSGYAKEGKVLEICSSWLWWGKFKKWL